MHHGSKKTPKGQDKSCSPTCTGATLCCKMFRPLGALWCPFDADYDTSITLEGDDKFNVKTIYGRNCGVDTRDIPKQI
ncbi:hypothetical protein FRX31_016080 [Thalictrum thalictroides]|uniref:Uncharacterized protein n=1 Tax=Thalictrum thalictroides TaxID=46969 RepID=A0A7J6WBJ0_THATH|nr:hypothetical protein FRX31_016080 [Thalictrum thalictroides]